MKFLCGVFVGCFLMLWIVIFIDKSYHRGQVDALNGKIDTLIVGRKDNSSEWKLIPIFE
jgi:hypothetical protein